MKKLILLTTILTGFAAASQANIVFSDSFSYANGNLVGALNSPWQAHSSAGSGPVQVLNGKAVVTGGSAEDVNADLSGAPYTTNSSVSLYSSYTLVVSNLPGVAGTYITHFRDTNTGAATGFGARVWVSATNAVAGGTLGANLWRLGIANGSLATAASGQIDQDLSLRTTYTVVTRFVPSTGVSTIWLNPSSESDPSVTATDAGTVARPNPIDVVGYCLRQASGEGTCYIDNLKVGTAFNNVAGTNTSPTISSVANQFIPASGSTGPIPFVVGDAESDPATLTVTPGSANTALVPVSGVVINNGDGTNRTMTVTPATGKQGTTTITLTVSDGFNTTPTTFNITVGAPLISAIPNQVAVSNTPIPAIPFLVLDPEGDTLNPLASSSNPTLLKNSNITINGTGSSRTVTLVPEANQTGVTTVTLSFNDGINTSARSFVLTVSPNLGVLLQDRFTYTSWNFVPQSLYDAVGSPWASVSGTAYQTQVTNGWAYLGATNSEDVAATLTNGPFSSTSGLVIYSSFTLRCTLLPTLAGNYFAHLKDSSGGTTFRAKVFTATNGAAASRYRIGLANSANTGTFFPLDCSTDSDYLVVTRYNSGTGESVLWVNPTSEASPSLAAADSPQTASVGAFGLREDTSSGTSGNLQISNLVVSTSFPSLPAPPVQPIITGIGVSGSTVTINFTAGATDTASSFQLYSAGIANGTYTGPAAGSAIVSVGTAKFLASVPTSGTQQFYRIKRTP